jgi:hypothetical protein
MRHTTAFGRRIVSDVRGDLTADAEVESDAGHGWARRT